jgi:NAD(P)H-flavin reductase
MRGEKVRLFGVGVGVSAAKEVAHRFAADPKCADLFVANGSRTEEEILYRDFFEGIHAARPDAVRAPRFAVTAPDSPSYPYPGYVQAHIADVDFDGADVLICGPVVACEALAAEIRAKNPCDLNLLIESFG